ncbi:MAG: cytochrome c [Chloroflexi bacterium]|nr:cytochrome c [Chloroflexota bacterium]
MRPDVDHRRNERPATGRVFAGLALALVAFLLVACQNTQATQSPPFDPAASDALPTLDAEMIGLGERIYQENCAACHGQRGEGQPNWKVANPDGTYPAPPHTAEGHTWHHGDGLLFQIVKEGGDSLNIPNFKSGMPAFGDKLTDAEIIAVLSYLKSLWPEEQRRIQAQASEQDPFPTLR